MSDFHEYENGVADILTFLVGDSATVERNVRVPSRSGGAARQVDVLVRGRVFGLDDVTLAVDCKARKRPITADHADAFVGFLDDVGADLGLLVATSGYSRGAKTRLQQARGASAEVVTFQELDAWRPKGTIHVSLRVPPAVTDRATKALRAAGMRVKPDPGLSRSGAEAVLEAFGLFGTGSADEQRDLVRRATAALATCGLPLDIAASGVSIGGGTPAHRWLEVTDAAGQRLGLKVVADTEEEVVRQLDRLAASLQTPRLGLDVERPEGWPVTGLFGLPSA